MKDSGRHYNRKELRPRVLGGVAVGIVIGILLCLLWHWYFNSNNHTALVVAPAVVTQPPVALPAKDVALVPLTCTSHDYTVVKGDTLSGISKAKYKGDANLWPSLYEANKGKIKDPHWIYPDQVFTIPCLENLPKASAPKVVAKKQTKVETLAQVARVTPPVAPPVQPSVRPVEAPTPVAPIIVPAQQVTVAPLVNNIVVNIPQPEPRVVIQTPPPAPQPPPPPLPQATIVLPPPQSRSQPPPSDDTAKTSSWVGSVESLFGNLPIERNRDNFVERFRVEAGKTIWETGNLKIQPYGAVTGLSARKDTPTLPWDQSLKVEAGLRVVRPFSLGNVQVGTGYIIEERWSGLGLPKNNKGQVLVFTAGEIGWNQPDSPDPKFPGEIKWLVGNTSPFERGNVIGTVRGEQGVTLFKIGKGTLGPQVRFELGTDKQKRPANNRWDAGADIKFSLPWEKVGTFDFRAGYACADQYRGKLVRFGSGCGPTIGVGFSKTWK